MKWVVKQTKPGMFLRKHFSLGHGVLAGGGSMWEWRSECVVFNGDRAKLGAKRRGEVKGRKEENNVSPRKRGNMPYDRQTTLPFYTRLCSSQAQKKRGPT
jgi:hypothetical protein